MEEFSDWARTLTEAQAIIRTATPEWIFLDLAQRFFLKAFFTSGLEQLLWHITALEALLGEVKELSGVIAILERRVAFILGKTNKARSEHKRSVRDLYDIRSDLVHGRKGYYTKEVYQGHLREARRIARESLLWMTEYLRTVGGAALPAGIQRPDRTELLSLLDFEPAGITRMGWLASVLPSDFPAWSSFRA